MRKLLSFLLIILLSFSIIQAKPNKKPTIQRTPTGVFDSQVNTEGNVRFNNTNFGMNFLNYSNNSGSAFWPYATTNQYMFGSGFWFATQKWVYKDTIIDLGGGNYDTTTIRIKNKLCSMTYDPNNGGSWYVPGRIEESDTLETDQWKHRIYFSTDFASNGEPKRPLDRYNYPIWNTEAPNHFGLGNYVYDLKSRTIDNYPKGPVYISDEDIFSTYKDTDIRAYLDTFNIREAQGYPLKLQVEQTTYLWNDDDKKDMIIMFYKVINFSTDTLYDCFVAPIFDPDIASSVNYSQGALNDRVKFYTADRDLHLGFVWSGIDQGEMGKGFGYLGVSMPLTPAVDGEGYLLPAIDYDDKGNQLGLITFRNWTIEEDITTDELRYDLVSSGQIDETSIPGDRRMLFSSGPFNMLPQDTVYFAIQMNFARASLGGNPTGEEEDVVDLVSKVRTGQEFLYTNVLSKLDEFNPNNSYINVYPNPANDIVKIEHNLNGHIILSVANQLGKIIIYRELLVNDNQLINIDLSNFNSGTYLVNIIQNERKLTQKFTVIK